MQLTDELATMFEFRKKGTIEARANECALNAAVTKATNFAIEEWNILPIKNPIKTLRSFFPFSQYSLAFSLGDSFFSQRHCNFFF